MSLDGFEPPVPEPGSHSVIERRELLDEFRKRFSGDELVLWDLRCQNLSWDEIAAQLGGSPRVLRQRYSRAVRRVARELGLAKL